LHTKLGLRVNKLRKEGNIPASFAYEVRFKGKQVKEERKAIFQYPLHTKLDLRENKFWTW